jgi:hypothetical protein
MAWNDKTPKAFAYMIMSSMDRGWVLRVKPRLAWLASAKV